MIPVLAPADSTYNATDCILPKTEVELIVGGTDLSAYYLGYDFGGSRGQQASGNIKLLDRNGGVKAKLSQFSPANSNIRSHNQTAARTISLTVSQGSATTNYPTLLPGAPSWDDDGTLSWAVTDLTPLLNKDNQSAEDVVWDEGGPGDDKSAADIIATLATMAGVPISHSAPNWDVRTWRMTQENLLSKIDDICRVTQSYRKWNGSSLVLERLNESLSSTFSAVDRFHIESLRGSLDDSGLRTFFKANRLRSQPQTLTEPRQGDTVGRVVEITFPPSQCVRIKTQCTHGTIGEGVFYEGDEVRNNGASPQTEFYGNPSRLADRWVGTYTPEFGDVAYKPWWWVSATGGVYNAADTMIEGFEMEKAVTAAESLFGRRPEFSNLATELIRDPETFQAMLDAIALEVLWSLRRWSMSTPFLCGGVREGQFMNVTHAGQRLTNQKCLVNGWRHSHSWESGWNNSFDLRSKL